MREIRINGRKEYGGKVTGEALVSPKPIEGFLNCDPREGWVTERYHPLYMIPFKGKILVYPYARGSGGITSFGVGPNKPAAFVHHISNPLSVNLSLVGGIPSVTDLETDPTTVIETGDKVFVNGDEGYIIVYKDE